MPLMSLQLTFKSFKQGKSISGSTGKSGQNFVMIKPADFTGAGFGYYGTKRYLAIATQCNVMAAPY